MRAEVKFLSGRGWLLLFACGGFFEQAALAQKVEFDHSHAAFSRVLKVHVHDGMVDYASLRQSSTVLNSYLAAMGKVTQQEFNRWKEDEQIAFLLNVYNAATLDLIRRNYPLRSVKDIGTIFIGPWKQKVVPLFGQHTTLDYLEHEILRKNYRRPEINFGLCCGARSCPPLRAEAYTAANLNAQLQDQAAAFLSDVRKNRVDQKSRVVHLSPIFKWYEDDFVSSGQDILRVLTPYFPPSTAQLLRDGKWTVEYTDYDWSLNQSEPFR